MKKPGLKTGLFHFRAALAATRNGRETEEHQRCSTCSAVGLIVTS